LGDVPGWRSIQDFYFSIIWDYLLDKALSVKVNVCTAFHDLISEVLIKVDGFSLSSFMNID